VEVDEGGLLDPAHADAALAGARDPSVSPRSAAGGYRPPPPGDDSLPPPRSPDGDGRSPTYMQARTMRETFAARLVALEFRERDQQLLDRAATESEAMALGRELRENLLAIPARLAQGLAECSDAAACETLLEHALTEALEALADGR
jgi:hypothetical protein